MIKIDVHQHLWTEELVSALSVRSELPFVRQEHGLTVLYLAGERPYVIDLSSETPERRADLIEVDGLDRAVLCLSSPLGIEGLPREQSLPLLEAYHRGALALGGRFGAWGAVPLDRPDPADVDRSIERGCIGVSVPAGAISSVDSLAGVRPLLARLELHGAPLFIHPGPGVAERVDQRALGTGLGDPLWWTPLTRYVAGMHASWLAFHATGRTDHPRLRVIFSMLAGLAPLHCERLASRGGPGASAPDPLVFYDTSSYGPSAVRMLEQVVGAEQLLYGSDRPVVEPAALGMPWELDWEVVADGTRRALGAIAEPVPL